MNGLQASADIRDAATTYDDKWCKWTLTLAYLCGLPFDCLLFGFLHYHLKLCCLSSAIFSPSKHFKAMDTRSAP